MIEAADAVKYGLASGIYTSSLANAMRTAARLEADSVWVNQYFNLVDGTPFGGYKEITPVMQKQPATLERLSVKSPLNGQQVPLSTFIHYGTQRLGFLSISPPRASSPWSHCHSISFLERLSATLSTRSSRPRSPHCRSSIQTGIVRECVYTYTAHVAVLP